jgi:hypothetical protein
MGASGEQVKRGAAEGSAEIGSRAAAARRRHGRNTDQTRTGDSTHLCSAVFHPCLPPQCCALGAPSWLKEAIERLGHVIVMTQTPQSRHNERSVLSDRARVSSGFRKVTASSGSPTARAHQRAAPRSLHVEFGLRSCPMSRQRLLPVRFGFGINGTVVCEVAFRHSSPAAATGEKCNQLTG